MIVREPVAHPVRHGEDPLADRDVRAGRRGRAAVPPRAARAARRPVRDRGSARRGRRVSPRALPGARDPARRAVDAPWSGSRDEKVVAAPAAPAADPSGAQPWPDVLATVAELQHPGRERIEEALGGRLYCFAGWLVIDVNYSCRPAKVTVADHPRCVSLRFHPSTASRRTSARRASRPGRHEAQDGGLLRTRVTRPRWRERAGLGHRARKTRNGSGSVRCARPAFATATNAVHASFFDVARMRRVAATILAVAIAW